MGQCGLGRLYVFCLFFDGSVFDGHDNALEECWTGSLYSTSSPGCGLGLAATILAVFTHSLV